MKTLEQILAEAKKKGYSKSLIKDCKSMIEVVHTAGESLYTLLEKYVKEANKDMYFNELMVLACWELINEKMKLNTTKEKLLDSLKKSNSALKTDYWTKVIEALEKIELPELTDGREYTVRWMPNGAEVIKHREFWDENLKCFNYDNQEIVTILNF